MDNMNWLNLILTVRKLIEPRNVNRFGKKECAVTGFDASFFITKHKLTGKNIL
jgi:hypothetical protein